MGKKHKSATPRINSQKKTKAGKEEKELLETVDSLLRLTTIPFNNVAQDLECQKQISRHLDRIRALEEKLLKKQTKTRQTVSRESAIESFNQWLKENDAQLNGCSIATFEGYDLGIKVEQSIGENCLVIAVPRKLMMSTETAQTSIIKEWVDKVEILKNMPNVQLAIHLLVEKFSENSFWKPYIDLLPTTYTTVLYFSIEELEQLKGSPTLEFALKQIKSIVRQYAYFYKLFNSSDDEVSQLMRNRFSFNEYCWAVSTIMTRQNMIPAEGDNMINALIPLWDLCNHSNGSISTDYNVNLDRCECLAFKEFNPTEQLFIFYGPRTNADFFIHNGFVYEDNDHDIYFIKFGISKSDPLQEKRVSVRNKLGYFNTNSFAITKDPTPISSDLLAFLRIFNMNEEQLDHWLNSDKIADLRHPECSLDTALEKKSWFYLQTRLNLLLASYKTKLEEDEELLKTPLSDNARMAVKMRTSEKRILKSALQYTEDMIKK